MNSEDKKKILEKLRKDYMENVEGRTDVGVSHVMAWCERALELGWEKGITEEAIGCHDHCKAEVEKAIKDTEKRMGKTHKEHYDRLWDKIRKLEERETENYKKGWIDGQQSADKEHEKTHQETHKQLAEVKEQTRRDAYSEVLQKWKEIDAEDEQWETEFGDWLIKKVGIRTKADNGG